MRDRDRRDRDRDRERDRDRDRERDRERDRDRRHRSKSPSRSSRQVSKPKKKKAKKSKKYSRRSRSSSRSTSRSSSSSRSSSRSTHSKSRTRDHHKSRSISQRKTRGPSSESNSRSATTPAAAPVKAIDLFDTKVQKALETIDEDTFKPGSFFSSRDSKETSDKVIIDLNNETVTVASKPATAVRNEDVIFHPNVSGLPGARIYMLIVSDFQFRQFLGDPDMKAEKWLRKLYNYRQKYMQE